MKNWIIVFILLLSIGVITPNYAQVYNISRYADDNGLPSRIVRDVIQDHDGYLWVAGNNGLFKFDGKHFQPYYSSLKDTTGLRDNKITALLSAQDKKLWIGTPKGLHVLEGDSIHYFKLKSGEKIGQDYIRSIVEDDNGHIWVATYEGLFAIDDEQAFLITDVELGDIPEEPISGISKHKNNQIWITTNNGRVFINNDENLFKYTELKVTYEPRLNKDDIIIFRILDYNEDFMIAESNLGLLKTELKANHNIHFSYFDSENGSPLGREYIYSAMVDHESNIWIATWKNRFKKFSITNGFLKEEEVIGSEGHFMNMSGNAMSVYEDSQQNIWIPNTNGLYKLTRRDNNIKTFPPSYLPKCLEEGFSIYAIKEDKLGYLWITTPFDLYRFKKSDLLKNSCPENYLRIQNDDIHLSRYMLIDSKNRLWLGSENGLNVTQLDQNSNPGKFIRFTTKHGLPHNWCQDIYEEEDNIFWIGNYAGLVKLTLDENDIENSTIKVYASNPKDNTTLVNSYTMEIANDKDNNKWIGTFFGLSKIISEENEGKFANYLSNKKDFKSLSNDAIKRVFRDRSQRLWIGTQTGLNLYDPTKDCFVQLGRHQGLPSEYILGIDEDSNGYLWVATTNGIIKAKYDQHNERLKDITHYTKRNGLADNITYRNALYIDEDNTVFAGSRNGLSIINDNTNNTLKTEQPFNLAINTIEVIDKNTSDFKSIFVNNYNEDITLSHKENSIKIEYAALDLSDASENQYRHKISPLVTDWVETGNRSELIYYNLNPGTYHILLDGSNHSGQWSNKPIAIDIIIKPPFYYSTLAKILYVLMMLGLIRFIYLYRIRKHMSELKQQLKLEKALLNERELLRQENTADFHDELGSKVTKISLFLTLAERNIAQQKDPKEWLLKIRENIKDLSGGFRDLLWIIDPKKDSLYDIVLRLKDYGEELFNNGQKDFSIHGNFDEGIHSFLDAQTKKQVLMIFKEAMNNCSKYSECSTVQFKITYTKAFSNFSLEDDGIGFDVSKVSQGRGLKNMYNRAQKISAELEISSNSDGTSITLNRIPHMRDNFKEKEA
ncbi:two-component regulator propeller domain-containing protein [Winogradskyella sp. 3972H.M.0a.05]|uniref:ligand-binding sensor domain-containing protein n=1 Tax=Winogradskyella sp. 3972H.M.0a.05 TaxID=2950277 RepID=UPI003398F753